MFIRLLIIYSSTCFTLTAAQHYHHHHYRPKPIEVPDPGAPTPLGPNEESYKYLDGKTIILSNILRSWFLSKRHCRNHFNGELIRPKTEELALFLGKVLAETDMHVDSMWIGLTKMGWIDGQPLNNRSGIMKYFIKRVPEDIPQLRNCYVFTRFNHEDPRYIDMKCELKRGSICMKQN